ncbi:MAG: GAF domain-containing SpoIIE family protein phosphatase [Bacteroidota bacterium]|jgi:serine phosphatase RsbU (regulator of sigma subunit)
MVNISSIKRLVLLIIPAILLPLVFTYDVIRAAVEFDNAGMTILRELFVITSFALIGLFIEQRRKMLQRNAPREIGRVFFAVVLSLLILAIGSFIQPHNISGGGSFHIHQSALTLLAATLFILVLGVLSLYLLIIIHDLVLFKRRKTTWRYYLAYLLFLFAACAADFPFLLPEGNIFASLFFSLAVALIIVNSFKQNWIVYLSKREKKYSIVYSVLLFIALVILDVYLAQRSGSGENLYTYSRPLHTFIQLNAIFGTVYFSVTFISTLFHLPTAEVFERKQSELISLHNLSRLVTQVFDFNDLLNTVTQMTSEVCGARSVWLELFSVNDNTGEISVEVVAKRNISQQEINLIATDDGTQLQRYLMDSHKALLIEDIWSDRRTKHLKEKGFARGSMLTVPLLSHGKLIGVLYATKDFQNAFDQDDIDVMTTFADHVSIAIENSRLISKSIERERLHQEMMVAQRMQKRLLPQSLPNLSSVEFAAVSESSLEVGGDYYDVINLPDERIGIVVGDVSGKGVSAAFYMAEVKGIVMSLSKICTTPRELLSRANDALMETLEKNMFISAIYAVLDVRNAALTFARAGHCPLIHVSHNSVELIRSTGIGLGLTDSTQFEQATEERTIKLQPGDICIFYTDGITESRNAEMEEYGYERLMQIASECTDCSANEMKERILDNVQTFIGQGTYNDDVTLIILKWVENS